MKAAIDVELVRNMLANIEIAQQRVANLSPEQKAWIMGARAMASWVLELPKGGRKLDELLMGIPLFPVVTPEIGKQALDSMRG